MDVQVCFNCEQEAMRKGEVGFFLPNIGNLKVPAMICNGCGESVIHEGEVKVLENVMKAVQEQMAGA